MQEQKQKSKVAKFTFCSGVFEDAKDVIDVGLHGIPDIADDDGLDDAVDVIQQDFQKEQDTIEPARVGPLPMSSEVVLDHLRSHHKPKAAWCPICQLAEAPPFKHHSLKRTETGYFSIDIAGHLDQDVTN
eukprot:5086332-Amphidinium_carterae.1